MLGVSTWPLDQPVLLQHTQDYEDQPVQPDRPSSLLVRYNAKVQLHTMALLAATLPVLYSGADDHADPADGLPSMHADARPAAWPSSIQ